MTIAFFIKHVVKDKHVLLKLYNPDYKALLNNDLREIPYDLMCAISFWANIEVDKVLSQIQDSLASESSYEAYVNSRFSGENGLRKFLHS